ncbi:MAG: uracil-DNA glycosylase, partial [Spongiibacteraceae bacterium]
EQGAVVYPARKNWFAALEACPFDQVKVVILGQDPYHGAGQAQGLAFSVPSDCKTPPSLQNIQKELASDLGIPAAGHGCLLSWAHQGVLLLNTVLTVEEGSPGSHQGRGWETLTDTIIAELNTRREGLVFMLWGGQAQQKVPAIDGDRHLLLCAPHPSPLSAYRGFFGCEHFSKANTYLSQRGESIEWRLPTQP